MRILFVCVENAGRSQMAEGFARKLAPPGVEIYSAGSQPAAQVNPIAVEAMQERGIDIRKAKPKGFADLPEGLFDIVVGMGCGDALLSRESAQGGQACPTAKAKQVISWEIPNPKGQSIEAVRQIRDTIESKVKALLKEVTADGS